MSTARFQLFHRIADPESAKVRQLLAGSGLSDQTQFRNVDVSDQARAELEKLAGSVSVPTLLEGGRAIVGRVKIEDYLRSLKI